MCGITLLYEPSGPPWVAEATTAMTRVVSHRGPDGEGLVFFQPNGEPTRVKTEHTPPGVFGARFTRTGAILGLGHRRLAILDVSAAGHQPMSDASEKLWIVYNGEIYNYLELREELRPHGHEFTTGSDTEVILAAWRQWGVECLARFNGMFAFALMDFRTRTLFVARDRFGVKPLYIWETPRGGVAIASEIKQFMAHPEWKSRLHGQIGYDFLNWGVVDHRQHTLFLGVRQLRGGEYIHVPLHEFPFARPKEWYSLPDVRFTGSFPEAAERFRELLDDSVRLRLRSDVPVGSCLSGGLDSSSIVCTMRAQLGQHAAQLQNTFSAYSDVARFDERSYIEEVAAVTGAGRHSVIPSPEELLGYFDNLIWQQDEPFGSTSIYAQWCVFRLAQEKGVKVMLDGQGADEALGGYHGYFPPRLAGLLWRGRWLRGWREAAELRRHYGQSWLQQTKLLANELLHPDIADALRRVGGRTVRSPSFLNLSRLRALARSPHDDAINLDDPVRSFSRAQLTSLNLPMLLHWEDRDSMAHGVEARLPFLDYRLVEFCLGLPEEYKLSDGWTKRVLREGLRGRLPERIRLRRDKLGFATAEEEWMRGPNRATFLALVDEAIQASGGILTPQTRRKAERMLSGAEPFNFFIWRIICFGRWLRVFSVDLPYSGGVGW